MSKYVWKIIYTVTIFFTTLFGLFLLLKGFSNENIYYLVVGATFWLYGLLSMKLSNLEDKLIFCSAMLITLENRSRAPGRSLNQELLSSIKETDIIS